MGVTLSPIQSEQTTQRNDCRPATGVSPGGFGSLLEQLRNKPESGKGTNRRESQRAEIDSAVMEASQKYQIDPELLFAVIKQESGFNPRAVSPCGAQGLMQLMPGTAKQVGVTNSFDIKQNVDGGANYLRQMLDQFDGDVKLALAGYNAGPHRVVQYGGIPPFAETQNYVKSITGDFQTSHQVKSEQLAVAMVAPSPNFLDLDPMKVSKEKSEGPPEPPFPGYQGYQKV